MNTPIVTGSDHHLLIGTVHAWLDLDSLAEVELTSEDPAYPIEAALLPGYGPGWRAQVPGPQEIRLLFAEPQRVTRIHLAFEETAQARTQELLVRWCAGHRDGRVWREVTREWHTFMSGGRSRQLTEYDVELERLVALELRIVPDVARGPAVASLAMLRMG